MGIGRISRGTLTRNQQVVVVDRQGNQRKAKVASVKGYHGLQRQDQ